MRSKSFEMQEVREIGRKEAGESRGFPIWCMGIIENVFQMEREEEDEEVEPAIERRREYTVFGFDLGHRSATCGSGAACGSLGSHLWLFCYSLKQVRAK